jgi:hypothetical protein
VFCPYANEFAVVTSGREKYTKCTEILMLYNNASQLPSRGPVVGPGINYTGPREALLEFVIFIFKEFFMNKYFIVEIF